MQVTPTALEGVLVLTPKRYDDARGYFYESYNAARFNSAVGREVAFVQDNHSHSRQGVIRGLHYQLPTPQAKLVRVVSGEIFDVAVDVRASSSTFGQWVGVRLSAENQQQLFIPEGFAHGFQVLSPSADVLYKTTAYYAPGDSHTIRYDDPDIGIAWPGTAGIPILSTQDEAGLSLHEARHF